MSKTNNDMRGNANANIFKHAQLMLDTDQVTCSTPVGVQGVSK